MSGLKKIELAVAVAGSNYERIRVLTFNNNLEL
jgi:hypothetical protein